MRFGAIGLLALPAIVLAQERAVDDPMPVTAMECVDRSLDDELRSLMTAMIFAGSERSSDRSRERRFEQRIESITSTCSPGLERGDRRRGALRAYAANAAVRESVKQRLLAAGVALSDLENLLLDESLPPSSPMTMVGEALMAFVARADARLRQRGLTDETILPAALYVISSRARPFLLTLLTESLPARPAQRIAGSITSADYPPDSVRALEGGSTIAMVSISVDGRVTGCEIVRASISRDLDALTCRLLTDRFRYRPAADADGRPRSSTVFQPVRWIP